MSISIYKGSGLIKYTLFFLHILISVYSSTVRAQDSDPVTDEKNRVDKISEESTQVPEKTDNSHMQVEDDSDSYLEEENNKKQEKIKIKDKENKESIETKPVDNSGSLSSAVNPSLTCYLDDKSEEYKECTLDFKSCTRFALNVYDAYMYSQGAYFGYTLISGKTDEKTEAQLQAEVDALISQARNQGTDVNIAAFDKLSNKAGGELKVLRARQVFHQGILGLAGLIYTSWPTSSKGKKCGPEDKGIPTVPNSLMKKELEKFAGLVTANLKKIMDKIADLEKLQSNISKARQEYLDALSGNTTNQPTPASTPAPFECANNPYLSGCYNRVTGGASGGNSDPSWGAKKDNVPNPESTSDPLVDTKKSDAGIKDMPATAASGSAGAADSSAGVESGGGGGGSGGVAGAQDDDKKVDKEKANIDLAGVSDYGSKKKKSGGSANSSGSTSVTNNKKIKNPFEDLFGNKKDAKDDRSGIHLRDIASANEGEDEELGFSNLFSRITKTYIKKYYGGEVGHQNDQKK